MCSMGCDVVCSGIVVLLQGLLGPVLGGVGVGAFRHLGLLAVCSWHGRTLCLCAYSGASLCS